MHGTTNPEGSWVALLLPAGSLAMELLAASLEDLGVEGSNVQDERALLFVPPGRWDEGLLARMQNLYNSFVDEGLLPPGLIEAREVILEDWVGNWRRALGAQRVGEQLVVVPPGVEAELEEGDILLQLEPRMAFGTGEHPTTRLALTLIEQIAPHADRVLDLGCGNGVLAIGAAKCGAGEVYALDIEEASALETLENAGLNSVSDSIRVLRGDVWRLPFSPDLQVDLLVANIFYQPIRKNLAHWQQHLRPGGDLVLTGLQSQEEADGVAELLHALGFELLASPSLERWHAAHARRGPA